MRVVVVGSFYVDSFASDVVIGLRKLGVTAEPYEVGRRPIPNKGPLSRLNSLARSALVTIAGTVLEERASRVLVEALRADPPDLILACYDYLLPRHVEALRNAGSAVCMWYPDALANFGRSYFLNAPYSALFMKDPYVVELLSAKLGKNVFYLPEAAWADDDLSVDASMACQITVAGNLYSYRQAFFARLADYDVRLWGNAAPRWMITGPIDKMVQNRYLTGQQLGRAYRSASIVINNLHPAEIWGINKRAFGVCGHGGFQMIDWRPTLDQLFEDGEELISFRDYEDLRSKIDHFLTRPEDRKRIALAGLERVRRDHTYEKRLRLLLDTIGGKASGFSMPPVKL